jgi:hypothetical protein
MALARRCRQRKAGADVSQIRVRVRVATSHEVEAYGGFQLPDEVLGEMAEAIRTGAMPMHFQHDISRPVVTSNVVTGTERLEDGHLAVWAEFDVAEDSWAAFEAERVAASAPGGMSFSCTGPLKGGTLARNSSAVIAADASHFTDDEIRAAAALLRTLDPDAGAKRLYQFSYVPDVKVVLDLTVDLINSLGPNLAASVIYDAAKSLLRPQRGATIFNVNFRKGRNGMHVVKVHIVAHTPEELKVAIAGLPEVLAAGTEGTFVGDAGGMRPIGPAVVEEQPLTED